MRSALKAIKTEPGEPARQLKARMATIGQLRKTVITAYLDPVPCTVTLRAMFDAAQIPRLKSNPAARRGGGPCYYSVAAVERYLKTRTLPGRLSTPTAAN